MPVRHVIVPGPLEDLAGAITLDAGVTAEQLLGTPRRV